MSGDLKFLEPRISIITLLVRDMQRSYHFYADGLGFPTKGKPSDDWIAFKLSGICLSIYPYAKFTDEHLSRRLDADHAMNPKIVPPVGLAYNTREKHQVEEVLRLAEQAGGTIEKQPADTFWGGCSGYFSDPDGHLWEVAWADSWKFNPDGSLILD
ncbi:MAG: VOC family protein [Planctomycetota bacterium]